MHSIRLTPEDGSASWQVIFVFPGVVEVIWTYETQEEAMGVCSYLNGGMCPAGYHLEVTCHH